MTERRGPGTCHSVSAGERRAPPASPPAALSCHCEAAACHPAHCRCAPSPLLPSAVCAVHGALWQGCRAGGQRLVRDEGCGGWGPRRPCACRRLPLRPSPAAAAWALCAGAACPALKQRSCPSEEVLEAPPNCRWPIGKTFVKKPTLMNKNIMRVRSRSQNLDCALRRWP